MHGEQCDCAEPLLWEPPSRQDHSQLTLSIMGCESTSSLLELLIHHQARMNGIHLSAALHRAIKLYRQEAQRPSWRTARMITGALLPLLTTELQSLMPSLAQQPHVVASVAHALGCLDVRDRDLLGGLAGLAQGCMTDISTQGLANILWAFARCEYQPSAGWMSAYVCACCARMSAFRPQELAMVLWGLSKLKYKLSPDMQQNFLGRARALFPSMGPQALCMLVYGLSMTGHHPGEAWLDSFVEAALQPPGLRRCVPPLAPGLAAAALSVLLPAVHAPMPAPACLLRLALRGAGLLLLHAHCRQRSHQVALGTRDHMLGQQSQWLLHRAWPVLSCTLASKLLAISKLLAKYTITPWVWVLPTCTRAGSPRKASARCCGLFRASATSPALRWHVPSKTTSPRIAVCRWAGEMAPQSQLAAAPGRLHVWVCLHLC